MKKCREKRCSTGVGDDVEKASFFRGRKGHKVGVGIFFLKRKKPTAKTVGFKRKFTKTDGYYSASAFLRVLMHLAQT